MTNYTYRKLQTNEFHLLVPLMKDSFGVEVNVKYFEWKFVNNPAGFVEGFIALDETNEVAAYYGAIPEKYVIENKEVTIYQSCDTMTHSKHRRKGLFQKLALECYEHLRKEGKLLVIGFGGGQSTPGFLKFGWVHTFNMRYYFFPKILSFFSISQGKNIVEITDLKSIENTIKKSNESAIIHSQKSLDVFKWRVSNPNFSYKIIGHKNNGNEIDSYLCYYLLDNKIVIFDFYFHDDTAAKQLSNRVKSILKKGSQKGIIAFVQENSLYAKSLSRVGFIYNPFNKGPLSTKVPFIFYSDDTTMERFNSNDKWLISSFDHDAM